MPVSKTKTSPKKVGKSKPSSSKSASTKKIVAKQNSSKRTSTKKPAVQKGTSDKSRKTKTTKSQNPGATSAASKSIKSTTNKPVKVTSRKSVSKISSSKVAASKVSKTAEPHALDDEVTEKVRQLIHLSSEQGFLTYKDVDKALPKIADQPEELQNVISIFNNLEIKLMDSSDVEKFKKKKEESEEETAKSNQSDMLDDPVRMYLKQMGKVPLLSREEEVDISKDKHEDLINFFETLEENDDVQNIYSNAKFI